MRAGYCNSNRNTYIITVIVGSSIRSIHVSYYLFTRNSVVRLKKGKNIFYEKAPALGTPPQVTKYQVTENMCIYRVRYVAEYGTGAQYRYIATSYCTTISIK